MSVLSLQTYQEPDSIRVALSGELDLSSALLFDDEMRRIEDECHPDVLKLDLRSLKFLDSTGLRLILTVHSRALKAGRRLLIVPGGEAVRRIFQMTGMAERLEIVDESLSAT